MGLARMSDLEALTGRVAMMTDQMITSTAAMQARTCHIAQGSTPALIAIGLSDTITVPWLGDGFPTATYDVEIIPLSLLGKGTWEVVAQDEVSVAVKITASLLIAVGTSFIVHGRS